MHTAMARVHTATVRGGAHAYGYCGGGGHACIRLLCRGGVHMAAVPGALQGVDCYAYHINRIIMLIIQIPVRKYYRYINFLTSFDGGYIQGCWSWVGDVPITLVINYGNNNNVAGNSPPLG